MRKRSSKPANGRNSERGSATVLALAMITVFMGALAFGVDYGHLILVRAQLQNAADSAALAGAAQLVDEDALLGSADLSDDIQQARSFAVSFAQQNLSIGDTRLLDLNDANEIDGDVVVGRLENPGDLADSFQADDLSSANSVQVNIRRLTSQDNPVDLFFSRSFSSGQSDVWATATATVDNRVIGLAHNSGSDTLYPILPFAVDQAQFAAQFAGGSDEWSYCPLTKTFTGTSDGIREIEMYPYRMKENPEYENPAGNFGTVDIGNNNNSTDDISNQILNGISASELDTIGGLVLDNHCGDWYKELDGDTGMSVAIKDELAEIVGGERLLPLFDTLGGSGDNATYRVTGFVPVRVADVRLTGGPSSRHVTVQPFQTTYQNVATAPSAPPNGFLYSLSLTR